MSNTDKEMVVIQLKKAKQHLETAKLWTKGMSPEDFHDVVNMIKILNEMLGTFEGEEEYEL